MRLLQKYLTVFQKLENGRQALISAVNDQTIVKLPFSWCEDWPCRRWESYLAKNLPCENNLWQLFHVPSFKWPPCVAVNSLLPDLRDFCALFTDAPSSAATQTPLPPTEGLSSSQSDAASASYSAQSSTFGSRTEANLDLQSVTVKNVTSNRACVSVVGSQDAGLYFVDLYFTADLSSPAATFNFTSPDSEKAHDVCISRLNEGKDSESLRKSIYLNDFC